jgi:UMF1 family MFS transporter
MDEAPAGCSWANVRYPLPGSADEAPQRVIFAWTMYDWANSAYSTLLITVVLHYLQEIVLPDRRQGPAVFAWGIGAAMLVAALLSPIVGAIADANRGKRRWLAGTAFGGALAAVALAVAPPEQAWMVVLAFVMMGVCFELSLVPYNGFLPEITTPRTINRVSAWGFALGYVGGSVPLVIAWLIVRYGQGPGWLGEADVHRCGILLLGLWWGIFSLPAVLILRDRQATPSTPAGLPCAALPPVTLARATRDAVGQVGQTLRHIRRFPTLAWFLVAFLFYNDGVQTVITQANTLANKELHFSVDELFQLVLMIQLIALPGSLAVGWLSDRLGQKPVLLGCLAVWAALLLTVTVVQSKPGFWLMGMVLALVLGGTQSVSRAMMSSMTPANHAAELFGFFNFSGKAASVLGPTQFGLIVYFTGNTRLAAVSLLVFFLIGGAIVCFLDVAQAQAARDDQSPS